MGGLDPKEPTVMNRINTDRRLRDTIWGKKKGKRARDMETQPPFRFCYCNTNYHSFAHADTGGASSDNDDEVDTAHAVTHSGGLGRQMIGNGMRDEKFESQGNRDLKWVKVLFLLKETTNKKKNPINLYSNKKNYVLKP